jgi:hypothetical protein
LTSAALCAISLLSRTKTPIILKVRLNN